MYQQEIDNFFKSQEEFRSEIEKLSTKYVDSKNRYKMTKKERKKAENSLKILKKEHDKLQKNYQDLYKNNQELMDFIEKERENNENVISLEENTQKNKDFDVKNDKNCTDSLPLLFEEKGCDTQDLIHFFDESTNTEEKFFDFYKKFVVNKGVQTEFFAKFVEKKPDIFDEFPSEKEKYRKRATIHAVSGEFLENFSYKLQRNSIGAREQKDISSNFRKFSENKEKEENDTPQKIDPELPKNQKMSVIFNEKTIQDKKLPKYVRKNQEILKNGTFDFLNILKNNNLFKIDKILEQPKKFSLSEPKGEPHIENFKLQKGKSLKSVLINAEINETNEKSSKRMSKKTMISNLYNGRNRKNKQSFEDKKRDLDDNMRLSIKNTMNYDNNNSKNNDNNNNNTKRTPAILKQNSVNFSRKNLKKQKTNIIFENYSNNDNNIGKRNRCLSYEAENVLNTIEKKLDFTQKNIDSKKNLNFVGESFDLIRKNENNLNTKDMDCIITNSEEQEKNSKIMSKDVCFSLENNEESSDFRIMQPHSRENKFSRSILKKKLEKESKSFETRNEYFQEDFQKVVFFRNKFFF